LRQSLSFSPMPRLSLRTFRVLLFPLLVAAGIFAGAVSADGWSLNEQEQAIANHLVNDPGQLRPFLRLDPILAQVARERAADMATRDYFSHTNPDGKAANYLVRQAGYVLPDWWPTDPTANYIESIAGGRAAPDATWTDWMNSPPHKTHILGLDPFYAAETSYGIGYAYDANSTYKHYWVIITAPPPGGSTTAMGTLNIVANGSGTVTAGLAGRTQQVVGDALSVTATPQPGFIFTRWTGGITSSSRTLKFTMPNSLSLTANFIANPWLSSSGNYYGIVDSTSPGAQGAFTLRTTGTGQFTARFAVGAKVYSLRGQLDINGSSSVTLNRVGFPPLTLTLNVDAGSGAVSGAFSDGITSFDFSGDKAAFSAADPTALAGRYTAVLPAAGAGSPAGSGYATVTVSAAGMVSVAGRLGDGSPFTSSSGLTAGNTFTLFSRLYAATGSIGGEVTFQSASDSDFSGTLTWVKPARPADKFYPNGFSAQVEFIGSRYTPPAANSVGSGGTVSFSGGNLAQAFSQPITISKKIIVSLPNAQRVTAALNPTTGVFSGSFRSPQTLTLKTFHGAFVQKQNAGAGYFLGTDMAGEVTVAGSP
ncbi:MAG: CAP domain-containing protein, partial [Verrucomicrobiota bacterium]|nr:CAP domain-containing protein [Verrucomicrobiota bacterium]